MDTAERNYNRQIVEEIIDSFDWPENKRPVFVRWVTHRGRTRVLNGPTQACHFTLPTWICKSPEWLISYTIHELAHCKSPYSGHRARFKAVEREMLQQWGLDMIPIPNSRNGYAMLVRFEEDYFWMTKDGERLI